ncbi:MAG TPA: hypothetical protein VFM70_07885 [Salinimicrobium sp.]|nr:hypothetical protein [Salinimicrobium sp.]
MNQNLNIAFFGSSIVSAYWNSAATHYRGIVKALHKMGHNITFYEPDIYERQQHRDIEDPEWCEVVVYKNEVAEIRNMLERASNADVIIKASGVGAFDELLEKEIAQMKNAHNLIIYCDVDAPVTLERIEENKQDPFNDLIPKYDFILIYGGGQPVIDAYLSHGAKKCIPIYNALDPENLEFLYQEKTKEGSESTFSNL